MLRAKCAIHIVQEYCAVWAPCSTQAATEQCAGSAESRRPVKGGCWVGVSASMYGRRPSCTSVFCHCKKSAVTHSTVQRLHKLSFTTQACFIDRG